jgi:hypothetical protein
MREVVENTTKAPCLFLQGASGELAPREQYTGDLDVTDRHGRTLGFAVLSTFEAMQPSQTQFSYSHAVESGAPLAIWETNQESSSTRLEARCVEVELLLKDWPTSQRIEAQIAECHDRAKRERLMRRLQTRRSLGDEETAKMPLWVWRVGDAVLVGQPNEAYSLWQREMRAAFPDHAIAVMNIVNGWYGYLPPYDCYDKQMYSVWQTPFESGSLEILIYQSQNTIKEMML